MRHSITQERTRGNVNIILLLFLKSKTLNAYRRFDDRKAFDLPSGGSF
jgi:hypothetical protein